MTLSQNDLNDEIVRCINFEYSNFISCEVMVNYSRKYRDTKSGIFSRKSVTEGVSERVTDKVSYIEALLLENAWPQNDIKLLKL